MGSCFEDLLERDTIVQSEFVFDGWFKNYNFFSFKIACMRHCTAVVKAEFNLTYNSASVRPAVIKSLPYLSGAMSVSYPTEITFTLLHGSLS